MAPRASKAQPSKPAMGDSDPKHNERAIEEGQRVQFLSFIGRLQQQQKKVDIAKAAAKVETDEMTVIYRYAKAAGFLRKDMQEILELMSGETRDIVLSEQERRKRLAWAGLITPETLDMFSDKTPTEEQDKAHWSGMGYAAGLRNDECKAPEACPARFVPAFTDAWHAGHDAMKAAEEKYLLEHVPGRELLKPKKADLKAVPKPETEEAL